MCHGGVLAAGAVCLRNCGTQHASATTTSNPQEASANGQPVLVASGMAITELSAAATPMVKAYTAVMVAMRVGKSRFSRLGNSTLPMAMPPPMMPVPMYSAATEPVERSTMPARITSNAANSERSRPKRRASTAANGDTAANASSGKVISMPALPELRPKS